jgi:hypothetical protein
LKRDTRHARRRASLAISSIVIRADSQASASICHARVISLSTEVTRFGISVASFVIADALAHHGSDQWSWSGSFARDIQG